MADYITREQQEQMGLLRSQQNNFVPAVQSRSQLPPQTGQSWQMDVTPSAQQQVIVRTSAVDRAKGYTITLIPLSAALAVLAVIVRVTLLSHPLLTLGTLFVFWLIFVLAWLVGWVVTLVMTPEFVSLYEAKRKWNVIEREQENRWAYYRGQWNDTNG